MKVFTGIKKLGGMKGFAFVSVGQLLSLLGSAMTRFALVFWAYKVTGQATALALMGFFAAGPRILLSPFAGVIVDRFPRKNIMIITDLASGLCMVAVYFLYSSGSLQIWHLYTLTAISSAFQALQFPAYSAAVTMMVPKENYSRANGILSTARSGSAIIAPPLAAVFLGIIGLEGIIAVEVLTLLLAVGILLFVRIPDPEADSRSSAGEGLLRQSAFGFRYIFSRPSLLGLQSMFFVVNLAVTTANILIAAYVLSKTGSNEVVLGSVQSFAGIGGLAGGLMMSLWGGPRNKVRGLFTALAVQGALAYSLIGMGRTPVYWMAGMFIMSSLAIIANTCSQTVWQSKVPPQLQGRVFATRLLLAQISGPLAMLGAGPLADRVFEPAMAEGGSLSILLGPLFGNGPGSGIGLIIAISGFLVLLTSLAAYAVPAVRNIETIIPDHDYQVSTLKGTGTD